MTTQGNFDSVIRTAHNLTTQVTFDNDIRTAHNLTTQVTFDNDIRTAHNLTTQGNFDSVIRTAHNLTTQVIFDNDIRTAHNLIYKGLQQLLIETKDIEVIIGTRGYNINPIQPVPITHPGTNSIVWKKTYSLLGLLWVNLSLERPV